MEIWSEIRREVLTGALSKRAAIAKYKVGWHTLKKMLANDEPPGYRQAKQRPKPKLDAFLPALSKTGAGRISIGTQARSCPALCGSGTIRGCSWAVFASWGSRSRPRPRSRC